MRCHLGSSYTLQNGPECQGWLENKQRHRVPAIKNVYTQCEVTGPAAELYTTQQEQEHAEELDLTGYGRKSKGASTLPERIISKTKAPRQQQQEEPPGSPKAEGYGK